MNWRTRLVLPTENDPSMHTFREFSSMGRSVYRRIRGGYHFESDAAVQMAAFFAGFVAQGHGSADAACAQRAGPRAVAEQQGLDASGALIAEREVRSFDARAVRVSGDFNRDGRAGSGGAINNVANGALGAQQGSVLSAFEFGRANGEREHDGFERSGIGVF